MPRQTLNIDQLIACRLLYLFEYDVVGVRFYYTLLHVQKTFLKLYLLPHHEVPILFHFGGVGHQKDQVLSPHFVFASLFATKALKLGFNLVLQPFLGFFKDALSIRKERLVNGSYLHSPSNH